MLGKDVAGTILVDAISNGKDKLAGNLDGVLDVVNVVLYGFSGANLLSYGWRGFLGLIPIALTGKYTTQHSVRWSRKHIKEDDA
jgi:cadmium resistance protein CadD (predicted permease)